MWVLPGPGRAFGAFAGFVSFCNKDCPRESRFKLLVSNCRLRSPSGPHNCGSPPIAISYPLTVIGYPLTVIGYNRYQLQPPGGRPGPVLVCDTPQPPLPPEF